MTQQGRLHGEGGGDNPCLYTMEAPVSEGKGVREGGEGGGYGIPPGYQLPGNYYSVPALKAPAPPPLARPPPATHPPGDHPVLPPLPPVPPLQVITPCRHWFCKECIMGWLDTKANCTLCRAHLT